MKPDPEAIARAEAERLAQGLPRRVEDPVAIRKVVNILLLHEKMKREAKARELRAD